jgi:hypothetical protein
MDGESAQRLVCVFMSLKRRVRAARPKTTSLYILFSLDTMPVHACMCVHFTTLVIEFKLL